MAVKDDSESSTEEGDNRIVGHGKPFTKGKGNLVPREERTKYKGGKDVNLGGKSSWQKGNGKTGGEGTEKQVAKATAGHAGRVAKAGHIAASCPKGGNKNLYPMGEEESEVTEEKRAKMNSGKKWIS